MSWADEKIKEYKRGKKATLWEMICLAQAEPLNTALAIVGAILLICGIWFHNWVWIGAGLVCSLIGHLQCWWTK